MVESGVELRGGSRAGVGDVVVICPNRRQLTGRNGNTFVKNGDTWSVERQHATAP